MKPRKLPLPRGAGEGVRGCAQAISLLVLLATACGYHLAPHGAPLAGGVTRADVRPFDNHSGDAEAGAFAAAAVREELARRNAMGEGAAARIEGVVEAVGATPSSPNGATWRLTLVISARLVDSSRAVAQARVARDEEYVTGQDPLETEGRRRLALRRATQAAARELVERLEAP